MADDSFHPPFCLSKSYSFKQIYIKNNTLHIYNIMFFIVTLQKLHGK